MSESADIETLPRRERELFELLYAATAATAAELHEAMADPPSYSAVRALMARLEARGLVRRRKSRPAIQYECVPQPRDLRQHALQSMVRTFFDGSAGAAATALLGMDRNLSTEELDAIQRMIDEAKQNGTKGKAR